MGGSLAGRTEFVTGANGRLGQEFVQQTRASDRPTIGSRYGPISNDAKADSRSGS